MSLDDYARFCEAALTAGALLSGFIGTFLSFRIQREANYYRQPVTKFYEGADVGRGQDAWIGRSQFNSSFLLIILAALSAAVFGILLPLAALACLPSETVSVELVLAGVVFSLVLAAFYFLDEMIHYEIIKFSRLAADLKSWGNVESVVVVIGILLALLFGTIAFFWIKCATCGLS